MTDGPTHVTLADSFPGEAAGPSLLARSPPLAAALHRPATVLLPGADDPAAATPHLDTAARRGPAAARTAGREPGMRLSLLRAARAAPAEAVDIPSGGGSDGGDSGSIASGCDLCRVFGAPRGDRVQVSSAAASAVSAAATLPVDRASMKEMAVKSKRAPTAATTAVATPLVPVNVDRGASPRYAVEKGQDRGGESSGRGTTALSAATALAAAALVSPTGKCDVAEARTHGFVMSLWRAWETNSGARSASNAAGESSGCESAAIAVGRDCTSARKSSCSVAPLESVDCENNVDSLRCVGSSASSPSRLGGDFESSVSSNEKRLQALDSRVESTVIRHRPSGAPRCDCTQLDSMKMDGMLHLLNVAGTSAKNSITPEKCVGIRDSYPQCALRGAVARRTAEVAYTQQLEVLVHSLIIGSLDIMHENRSYRERSGSASRDKPSVSAK